ncbi:MULTISPECIES: DUF3093 domain-containing protein [unclassified Cryobacterium]|uniref:DUF3093 domain-containing protein n=1 Tax=unclassified Cryobacterium TaxID=2649013 RepID=UPI001444EFEC|nr:MULTISPECIES: DUF3093 domain-containing protein [unclassified Cryobacterium]
MTIYREKLNPSVWLYVIALLVIPASLLVFLPINVWVGVAVAVVLYAGCVVLLLLASPVLEVTDGEFIAGRARLPIAFVGVIEGFRASEATLERGQRLDARAWLVIRGWIDPVLKVEVTDPKDPVPYWLVSTRRPDELKSALEKAKAGA